jgi:hypothetical protein
MRSIILTSAARAIKFIGLVSGGSEDKAIVR